ncbi:N-acetylmuramoyl-L-alanine amidase [Streptomyces antarcticus]|uniref:N-acetylmuramoyl-L-alanine amidase n=1 Tax=Streptomyces antarcticus TaxID=2996458 RepID=UPI00226F4644|nr:MULTISPECIES: N-acetylmuramoyl-L-alanine amidase [unclassified Streptomyces]MCY0941180.1 N-acetylmuramoyl-L-alanine amidase [Streptomyces sp. H34-AA3]MCZ4085994.1 N-acetylmuramoyl-L-alanine amidase [Streptomyces sp. H34-S5]
MVREGAKDGKAAGRPRRTRRAVLLGGLGVVAAAAVVGRDELGRAWWLMPGVSKPRKEGEIDHTGAGWTAASPANWRLADRPDDYRVDRIVVHVTQGGFGSSVDAFKNPWHKASAHYIVRQDGHVEQMVRELDVAFHAGNRSMNERSVGIEHVGFVDRPQDFTDAMYAASAVLAAGICRRYGIPADRTHIVGHSEVPGADHTDPGRHWDWDRYVRLVGEALRAAS